MSCKLKMVSVLTVAVSLCFGYNISDVPEGWASQGGGTTGGQGGTEVEVSSMSELKSAIGASGKKIILVKPGTYSGGLSFSKSDKSVLGTAPGVLIKGQIKISAKNIIIRNIATQDGKCSGHSGCGGGGDGIYIGGKGAENIWLDHMDIMDGKDGALDVTKGPTNISITWCKIHYTYKKDHPMAALIAGSDGETESKGRLCITYAYNWWGDNLMERMPRGRFGKIHVLNNLYTSKRCNYILGPGDYMQMLIENNVFNTSNEESLNHSIYDDGKNDVIYDWEVSGSAASAYKSSGNIGTNPNEKNASKGDVFTPPYTIKKYEANEVEALVRKGAGNVMTLGETSIYEKTGTNNVAAQPRITATKSGWSLHNPGSTTLSFTVVTLQGKTVLQTTTLEAGKSTLLPSAVATLVIKFKSDNVFSDIYVPIMH